MSTGDLTAHQPPFAQGSFRAIRAFLKYRTTLPNVFLAVLYFTDGFRPALLGTRVKRKAGFARLPIQGIAKHQS